MTIGRQAASLEENIRGNIKGRGGVAVNGVLEESVVYVKKLKNLKKKKKKKKNVGTGVVEKTGIIARAVIMQN